jgi:hypothetical protein
MAEEEVFAFSVEPHLGKEGRGNVSEHILLQFLTYTIFLFNLFIKTQKF